MPVGCAGSAPPKQSERLHPALNFRNNDGVYHSMVSISRDNRENHTFGLLKRGSPPPQKIQIEIHPSQLLPAFMLTLSGGVESEQEDTTEIWHLMVNMQHFLTNNSCYFLPQQTDTILT